MLNLFAFSLFTGGGGGGGGFSVGVTYFST